ncbi:MAG TPA: GlsB/YeaQ/YmgE family stress response membrane protein [Pirellula sp.]|nr:GlsB/YeaQ/YmgE family stress response membrane protein [Pirellula sp.]
MFGFIWWIVIGLVAGLLARFLMPGDQPMGWLVTIVLGLIGSLVGGFISSAVFGTDPRDPNFQASGLVMSTVGALVVLALYLAVNKRPSKLP